MVRPITEEVNTMINESLLTNMANRSYSKIYNSMVQEHGILNPQESQQTSSKLEGLFFSYLVRFGHIDHISVFSNL